MAEPFPNTRRFAGKKFEIDYLDDGTPVAPFNNYISNLKKRGVIHRTVTKGDRSKGTLLRAVYIVRQKPPRPPIVTGPRGAAVR